jgi:hypothetical protein
VGNSFRRRGISYLFAGTKGDELNIAMQNIDGNIWYEIALFTGRRNHRRDISASRTYLIQSKQSDFTSAEE